MIFTPKFQDGEKVLLYGEVVTIKEWGYASNMKRYTYTIVENPGYFYFEGEINKSH